MALETCLSMAINSGKHILEEPLTFTPSYGNFNNNIVGLLRLTTIRYDCVLLPVLSYSHVSFSLRTSETNYLNEAYSFYAAIRGRAYYSRAAKEDRSDLMVKKLRYYARFIVVCLLLKKMKLVRDLVMELDNQIADYTSTYEPDDQLEWSLVLEEIKSFIKADGVVSVLHADSNTIVLSHRLSPLTTPPVEKSPIMNLTLQEILIVGNCNDQVKFSELTMDMFRMLQTLEREPQEDFNHIYDSSPAPGRLPIDKGYAMPGSKASYPLVSACQENGDRPLKRENPHKYLLYKPTLSQVLVFLASGFKELPPAGALLLYLSADGCFSPVKHPEDNQQHNGSLFTLFLHSPLTAFCFICNILNVPIHHWERCQSYIDRFVTEASRLFTRCRIDSAYLQFFGDDFLRLLLLRYIFCDVVLHLHRSFKGRQFRPRCQPALPDGDLLDHPALQHLVLDLASHLEVRGHFMDSNEMD
uniref:Protein SCAI n=1 Tax=Timema cristinae TaxID=61476 RepID=A0A7R9GUF7_TIMCR|nr:unnamed protein product [Timema cristinae]